MKRALHHHQLPPEIVQEIFEIVKEKTGEKMKSNGEYEDLLKPSSPMTLLPASILISKEDDEFIIKIDQTTLEGLLATISMVDGDLLKVDEYRGVKNIQKEIEAILPTDRLAYLQSQEHLDDAHENWKEVLK